jgi:hypothetical protein
MILFLIFFIVEGIDGMSLNLLSTQDVSELVPTFSNQIKLKALIKDMKNREVSYC